MIPDADNGAAAADAVIASVFRRVFPEPPIELERTFEWVHSEVRSQARFLRLPLLTYQATWTDSIPSAIPDAGAAVPLGAAWHLFYCAARLLDDLEDGDDIPVPGLGPAQTVNAATALIFAAQLALASLRDFVPNLSRVLDVIVAFNTATARMSGGQASDLALGAQPPPTPQAVQHIAGLKSGEFFAAACRAGALLSNAGAEEIAICTTFGYNLGMLVQVGDDFRALWAPGRRGDLTAVHRTLPVAYAWSVADPDTGRQLAALLDRVADDGNALATLQHMLAELGAPHYTAIQAGLYHTRASQALLSLPRPSHAQQELLALLDTGLPAMATKKQTSPCWETSAPDSNNGQMT